MGEGKARELLGRAESLGLRLEYTDGFLLATYPAADQATAAEIEAVILELGECLSEVRGLAIGAARAVRGKDFLGQQVLITDQETVGKIRDCSVDEILTVSYRVDNERKPEAELVRGCRGDELFIITLTDEQPDRAYSTIFPAIASEKVRELLECAERAGVHFEHDAGFVVAKWRAVGDGKGDLGEAAIRELGRFMNEVFETVAARARFARGRDFTGQRVFVPALEDATATLVECQTDGKISVTYHHKHLDAQLTGSCNGDELLIVVGDERAARASLVDQKSEPTWRNLLRRARDVVRPRDDRG